MKKLLSLFLVGLLICSNVYGAGLDANTKLYLPFDENTLGATTVDGALEVLDYGSGGNVITQVGTATYQTTTTKVWNAAVDFDGNNSDYLQVNGLLNTLATATSGAIAFWIYVDADGGVIQQPLVIGNTSQETRLIYYNNYSGNDLMQLYMYIDGTLKWAWQSDDNFLDDFVGSWKHVIINHNGTTPSIWVNGVDETTNSGSFTTSTDLTVWFKALITDATNKANVVYLGTSRTAFYFHDGKLDDFRIFTDNLTSGEISTLYGDDSGTTSAIGDEVFWIKGCQDQSGDGGSGTYHIPDFVNVVLDTDVTKYAGDTSSGLFNGTNAYVTLPDSADWDICGSATQDYTIDCWIKLTDHTGNEEIFSQLEDNFNWMRMFHDDGVGLKFDAGTANAYIIQCYGGGEITDTDWHHVALIKWNDSGTTKWGIYLDGTQVAYVADNDTDTYSAPLVIGCEGLGTQNYLDGNIAHFRIQKSNIFSASPNSTPNDTITVPTAPYTAVSGWTHSIYGIPNANIAKINGIPIANIKSVCGIE